MIAYLSKKEYENFFSPFQIYADIRVLKRLTKVPSLIADTAIRLSKLDFIKHVKILENEIVASNMTKGTRVRIPISEAGHELAVGIRVVYHLDYKLIDFDEINSPIKGNGHKMVDCVLKNFPKDWKAGVFMDWSNGFWNNMKEKYGDINWLEY